jgi:hypothetical protein
MNRVIFYINTLTSWHNWDWLWRRFFAVCKISNTPGRHCLHLAEDTLQPVDPVSQYISPFINPLKSPIPIYPSQINMTVHHPNAVAFYFSAPSIIHIRGELPPREFTPVISLLTGLALEWATAVRERGEEELDSYEGFMDLFV